MQLEALGELITPGLYSLVHISEVSMMTSFGEQLYLEGHSLTPHFTSLRVQTL